jgi:hypothetical protein
VFATPNRSKRQNYLQGVVSLAPNNVWAGGYSQTAHGIPRTLILHWDGRSWTIAQTPNPGSAINVIWGMGQAGGHVWAAGHYSNDPQRGRLTGLLLRQNGSSWIVTPPPRDHRLFTGSTVAGTGPNDAWAVGGWPNGGFTLLHYNGKHWSTTANAPTNTALWTLADVVATSTTNAWAIGIGPGNAKLSELPIILHWNGTAWRFTKPPWKLEPVSP